MEYHAEHNSQACHAEPPDPRGRALETNSQALQASLENYQVQVHGQICLAEKKAVSLPQSFEVPGMR